MNNYQLTLGVSLRLLGMQKDRSNNMLTFKTGKFKPDGTTKFQAELLAGRLLDLRPYLEKNVWSASEFIHALKKVYGKVGHDELIRKLSQAKYRIPVYKRQIDYIRALADIYNFGRQNRVNFE